MRVSTRMRARRKVEVKGKARKEKGKMRRKLRVRVKVNVRVKVIEREKMEVKGENDGNRYNGSEAEWESMFITRNYVNLKSLGMACTNMPCLL